MKRILFMAKQLQSGGVEVSLINLLKVLSKRKDIEITLCVLKKDGIYYYCNIASPFVISDDTIKYIDYDLDLRVFPNGSFKILDRMEYRYHKKQMHYSSRLDFILKYELGNLIDMVRTKEAPFNKKTIEMYHQKYVELVENNKE